MSNTRKEIRRISYILKDSLVRFIRNHDCSRTVLPGYLDCVLCWCRRSNKILALAFYARKFKFMSFDLSNEEKEILSLVGKEKFYRMIKEQQRSITSWKGSNCTSCAFFNIYYGSFTYYMHMGVRCRNCGKNFIIQKSPIRKEKATATLESTKLNYETIDFKITDLPFRW